MEDKSNVMYSLLNLQIKIYRTIILPVFLWVWNLVVDIAGGKEAEGVWEHGIEENIWMLLEWNSRRWYVGIWNELGWPRIETGGGRLWVR